MVLLLNGLNPSSDPAVGEGVRLRTTTPGGEEGTPAGCGPLQSLGGRLRSSRSLQNLEQATKDSMRAMVDKTSYTASSMKHRYIFIIYERAGYHRLRDASL